MNHVCPAGQVAGELVSLAGLRGRSVYDRTGGRVGRLVDLVVRPDAADPHPPIQGALVRARCRLRYIPEAAIVGIRDGELYLCTVGLAPRTITAEDRLVRLAHHVLLSTSSRVSDIILASSIDAIRLVGIDTTIRTLLRRLVPTPVRQRVYPERLHPWPPLGAPKHSKPRSAPPTANPPRPSPPALPRAGQATATPPFTPYVRRSRSEVSGAGHGL